MACVAGQGMNSAKSAETIDPGLPRGLATGVSTGGVESLLSGTQDTILF